MTTSNLRRPIGFHPRETSNLTNELVVEQHVEEAAFLWNQRDRAVRSPLYKLKDLKRIDGRLEAHLDGLRVARDFGRSLWDSMLQSKRPGEFFTVAVLAFESDDEAAIKRIFSASGNSELLRAVVSALGWIPACQVRDRINGLLMSGDLVSRRVGIAASAVHRLCSEEVLRAAMMDRDPVLRARAYRAVAECGFIRLLPNLRSGFEDLDLDALFAAAWSATRLSANLDSLATLRLIAESPSHHAYDAIALAIRRLKTDAAKQWVLSLGKRKETVRTGLIGAASTGDPSLIPWIMSHFRFPEFSRAAGRAFAMITGANFEFEDLDCDRPEGLPIVPNDNPEDEEVEMEEDIELRWPDPKRIDDWWKARRGNFANGERYLCGKAINDATLQDILTNGFQPDRMAAAMEIGLRDPMLPLFEVRGPAQKQIEDLRKWS